MKLTLAAHAEVEYLDAVQFYATQVSTTQAKAFVAEFHRALTLIASNPRLGTSLNGNTLHYLLRRFPCKLVYIAVAHMRRRPNYWRIRK